MGGTRLTILDMESFMGELSASWSISFDAFHHGFPSEIQIPTGKLFWNKVQSSYPAAITGPSDVMQTKCSHRKKSQAAALSVLNLGM